jgi:hypothetical protein
MQIPVHINVTAQQSKRYEKRMAPLESRAMNIS